MRLLFVIFCFSLLPTLGIGQQLVNGTVFDERNIPIPFAKIFVKNDPEQRTIADANGYYEMRLFPGEYFLVFSATGYDTREGYITITDADVQRNFQLLPTKFQDLEDVEISVKKSNPGREIMLKVVEKRDLINPWNYPHSVDVYIKASEKIDKKESKTKNKAEETSTTDPSGIEDPFETEKKKRDELANNMNLVEVQLTRNFSPPNDVKEFRNGFEKRGNDRLLYYTTTVKSNFNFFENLLHLDDLHQTPVSSPISGPGILSYKYRLEEQYLENGQKIHKIKIIARNSSTSTLEGYIWVIDSLWLVKKLDLTMEKGNLLIYDYFSIQQEFEHPGDTLCLLKSQSLIYGVKYKDESSDCKTIATFSNYNFRPSFAKRFFNSEVAVTEQEAYDKDTSYWAQKRTVDLTVEERAYIIARDSINDWYNRKEYLDSIDSVFNRITLLKIAWWGIEHRNREKRYQWILSSAAALIRPMYIAGPRISPWFDYFKKWPNERFIELYTEVSYGFFNQDIKGRTRLKYRYDPFHFGTARISFSHDFDAVRSYDAITQIYKRSNFIETTMLNIGNDRELFNGFYMDLDVNFAERRSLDGYTFFTLFDEAIPNNDPTEFESYQALIGTVTFSYTPKQKYMREPHRKVLLGSRYPTFYLTYERGVPGIFGSDVNHEYARLGMTQTFKISTFGTSSYHLLTGKFLSAKSLKDADFKFQRRSDPFIFSNPLYSFQGFDTSLPSRDIFYEFHFVHHDNGAIINKIPFMKKTRIGLVAGFGALYVKEFDYQHYELLAGLERNFKFSKRRLRLGVYGVLSDGNRIDPTPTWKVSFTLLDDRNMKWNF